MPQVSDVDSSKGSAFVEPSCPDRARGVHACITASTAILRVNYNYSVSFTRGVEYFQRCQAGCLICHLAAPNLRASCLDCCRALALASLPCSAFSLVDSKLCTSCSSAADSACVGACSCAAGNAGLDAPQLVQKLLPAAGNADPHPQQDSMPRDEPSPAAVMEHAGWP